MSGGGIQVEDCNEWTASNFKATDGKESKRKKMMQKSTRNYVKEGRLYEV